MAIPAVAALAIPPLINAASNVITNIQARRQQEKANQQNQQFWNLQNEYNSPTSQMARLRQAGLNPGMMYGGMTSGATGNAAPVAPARAPETRSPINLPMINFADFKVKEAQTDNLKAQNTVYIQDALLKAALTAESTSKTARNKFDLELSQDLRATSIQAAQAHVNQMRAQIAKTNLETTSGAFDLSLKKETRDLTIEQKKAQIGLTQSQTRYQDQATIEKQLMNHFNNQTMVNRIMQIRQEAIQSRINTRGKDLELENKRLENELKNLGIFPNDPWYIKIMGNEKLEFKNTYLNGLKNNSKTW